MESTTIRSKLQQSLKYLLPRIEISQYWGSKRKLKFLVNSDSKEDLEVWYYIAKNINMGINQ